MERLKFFDVFQINPDGSLTPRQVIEVNGVTFGTGVSFGSGVSFGGVNFHDFKYLDIAVERKGEVLVVKGFYQN